MQNVRYYPPERRAHEILTNKDESTALVDKNAPWRSKPASEGQIKMLRWYNMPIPQGITSGQAADLIDQHKTEIERRKAAKKAVHA